jgi:branched-chain amino acid transport system substrate-binding protein
MKRMGRSPRRPLALAAAGLAVALLVSACGSDDDDATDVGDAGIGTPNKATGQPIKVGYVSTGKTTSFDSTAEIETARAAVSYVNDYLGGINGRPIELDVCETTVDPARATDCANKLIGDKVAAVLGAVPNGVDPLTKGLTPAGIPFVIHQSATTTVLQTPGVFLLTNPLSAFGGPATYARDKGIKKAAMVTLDVPAAVEPAKAVGAAFFKNAGATLDIVAIPAGTADMTPQIQSEQSKKPELYHIIGDPNFCQAAIKAIKGLGLKTEITMIPSCVSATNAQGIPGGFEGITSFTGAKLEGEEFTQLQAVLKKYKPDVKADARTAAGFQVVVGFQRAIAASRTTDFTAAGVLAALKSAPAVPYPLSDGQTFKCDGTALAISKNVCSAIALAATADKDGNLSGFTVQDSKGIYQLG